jgi:hypothetical protein
MAKIKLHTYKVHDVSPQGFISISIGLGEGPPFPDEVIEATKLGDVQAKFEDYKARAAATGKRLQVTATVMKGSRAPAGFKNWRQADRTFVNI